MILQDFLYYYFHYVQQHTEQFQFHSQQKKMAFIYVFQSKEAGDRAKINEHNRTFEEKKNQMA